MYPSPPILPPPSTLHEGYLIFPRYPSTSQVRIFSHSADGTRMYPGGRIMAAKVGAPPSRFHLLPGGTGGTWASPVAARHRLHGFHLLPGRTRCRNPLPLDTRHPGENRTKRYENRTKPCETKPSALLSTRCDQRAVSLSLARARTRTIPHRFTPPRLTASR